MASLSLWLARSTVAVGRVAWRICPAPVRTGLEDRVFYAIFQKTRVENDAYGWRPERPTDGTPPGS